MTTHLRHDQRDHRVARATDRARRLVDAHHTVGALRLLRALDSIQVHSSTQFEIESLRIQVYIDVGRFQEAKTHLKIALALVATPDQRNEYNLLTAHCLARMSSARPAVQLAFGVLRDVHSDAQAAKARWVVGVALYRAGHYRWARQSLELSAAYYRLTSQKTKVALLLENIALVVKNQGRAEVALEYFDQAMDLYPRRGYWRLRSYCQLHRGICFLRLGDIPNARVALLEARGLAMRAVQGSTLVSVHNHLGHVYRMEGNYATSLEFHREALQTSRRAGIDRQAALALEFIGETLTAEGKAADALIVLDEALQIAARIGGRGDLFMEILRRRGEARLCNDDRVGGLEDLREAMALCSARGEVREELLTRRAHGLATATSTRDLLTKLKDVLAGFHDIGDRFEYARTVCFALEHEPALDHYPDWLVGARSTAAHYFNAMGLGFWSARLQRVGGHGVHLTPESIAHDELEADVTRTSSPRFADAIEAARLAARSSDPALILGETGAGKEVIARLVHQLSSRATRPLIAINCGAIPPSLIESELFGHVRGAFTGADRDRAGLFETAHGGTVFLDEIGDLPADVQVKLLRFLDHYEYHRIGEHRVRKADVRILAATHKDMAQLVERAAFRQDLYFRLNVFAIEVPALRDRREDIPALVQSFLRPDGNSGTKLGVTPDLLRYFEAYPWPGNVRELRNLCRYLAVRCWGRGVIEARDLPVKFREACREVLNDESMSSYERERVELERTQIRRALLQTGGSISDAARLLGMHRNIVSQRMRQHGITREMYRKTV